MSALVDGIPIDTIAVGTPKGHRDAAGEAQRPRDLDPDPGPGRPATLQGDLAADRRHVLRGSGSRAQSSDALKVVYKNLQLEHAPAASRTTRAERRPRRVAALVFILAGIVLSGLWFGRVA